MAIQAKSGTATLTELSEKQKAVLALRLKKQNYQSENSIAAIEKIQRVPKENYIASYSQKRFWFLDQFSSNKAVNYVHLATKLTGRLDFKALQKTADEILRRHEVLRMVYRTVDDEVYCTFHSNPKCEVRVKKVAALGKQSLKKKINSEILSEITAPFDLAKDIPIRISVLNTGRDEHILIVVMHHIAADMWSLRILDKEMEILYNHYAFGAPLELEPLPVQYLDYAAWQRKRLENTDNTAEIDYWKSALKGAPHCLKLPTDFPRPAVQTYNGATHKFYFPEDLSKSIKKACAQQAVTPFVFMLAAFAVLLSRYSGMNDIVIGSPVAGRMNKSVEKLIGLFINTIAIRIKLTEECSVGELLQRVKKVVGGAMAHQEYPFEKLVRELETPQNLSYTPVFQAMFNYQSIEKNVTQFSGMQAESVLPVNNTAKFDINLAIKHMMGGIIGQLTYNTDLFLPQTIERITKHYLNVLRQMTASSEISFAQLELLDEHEKETIINNLSRTQKADYRYIPYFHRLFEEQAEKTPNATAIVCDGRFYTYGELNARANKLAGYLQKLGISPEKCVGLFLERSLELVVGILGILKAGGAYVPLDPIFPDERMRHIIYDAKIEVVVTQQSLSQGLCNMASLKLISLDSEWDAIENFPAQNPDVGVLPDNLMYVLYTSGSTGKPKGVEVEHKNYIN
ncbi:MAG TPA: non-ribosomal peptide synthetase, partial [Ruminococcaceae bacterium]|nr:non-ribosomal peptide synthetase [Oscillospiraceae bacterium]